MGCLFLGEILSYTQNIQKVWDRINAVQESYISKLKLGHSFILTNNMYLFIYIFFVICFGHTGWIFDLRFQTMVGTNSCIPCDYFCYNNCYLEA